MNSFKAENSLLNISSISFLLLIYACVCCSTLLGSLGKVYLFDIGALTIPSLFLFIVICGLAIYKRKYYFLFLIFVILSFPAPIDDIFPSVVMTNPDEKEALSPLITRIDIYLILGIILGSIKKGFKFKTIKFNFLLKLFFVFYVIVFLINILKSKDIHDFNLLLVYSFQIRYFILFLILLQIFDINKFQKEIVLSFIFSLIFIYVEAQVNTAIKGEDRLTSGSLALNTFANIFGAIGVYIFYLNKNKLINKWYAYLSFIIVLLILIGSETRGAILTIILTYFFINFFENPKKITINFLKITGGILLFISIYFFLHKNNYVPNRYSYERIADKIEIDFSKDQFLEIIKIKYSTETTSIKSRFELFNSSINMIEQNPLTGIGVGRWNKYKNNYSDDAKIANVLLDTHNDYLALASQYGIILGLLFAFLVFFYPMLLGRRNIYNNPLGYLYIISIAMSIAAFSNAGFFKHQVSAVLIFCLCVTYNLYYNNAEN